jgi:hypothetical protein
VPRVINQVISQRPVICCCHRAISKVPCCNTNLLHAFCPPLHNQGPAVLIRTCRADLRIIGWLLASFLREGSTVVLTRRFAAEDQYSSCANVQYHVPPSSFLPLLISHPPRPLPPSPSHTSQHTIYTSCELIYLWN